MQLIESIEIGYFRSIYKQRLDDLGGVTILFGRNDSGKSNVLRALNLFFNGQTNPGQQFSFERDLSHARLAEAADKPGARKFVYVKLTFTTPRSWQNSLGRSFWVRKSWSITKQSEPNLESSIVDKTKHQYLTRFLNKVKFHYIPAIKDRRIFEELLGNIYSVVANQREFLDSLREFSSELRARTVELSNGLLNQLAVRSVIAPPTDLNDLFRSLDFETQSDLGDSYSLTLQRGDGIQVRHIPAILAFLSDRSPEDYHIWGFEEPENSLELANAIAEAEVFCRYGEDNNKQIFLTSHSPAFFALDRPGVQRFFVSRSKVHVDRKVSDISLIPAGGEANPSEMMGETPHLPVISQYLRDADAHIKQLQEQETALVDEIARRDRSILFVEGYSDAAILRAAWQAFAGGEAPFQIEPAAGTTKMESLAQDGPVLNRLAPARKLYVLVDNDREGRELYKNSRLGFGGKWVRHNSNGTLWCRLPWTAEFRREMTNLGVPQSHWPGTIENLFSRELRMEAIGEGIYLSLTTPHAELTSAEMLPRVMPVLLDVNHTARLYVTAPSPDSKLPFAEWVATRAAAEPTVLEPLRGIIEALAAIIEEAAEPNA